MKPGAAEKVDADGRNNLHVAALLKMDHVASFVAAGNLVQMDKKGRLPVWYTATKGNERLFQKLLEATGLQVNIPDIHYHQDCDGATLAQFAMAHGLDYAGALAGTRGCEVSTEQIYPTLAALHLLPNWNGPFL